MDSHLSLSGPEYGTPIASNYLIGTVFLANGMLGNRDTPPWRGGAPLTIERRPPGRLGRWSAVWKPPLLVAVGVKTLHGWRDVLCHVPLVLFIWLWHKHLACGIELFHSLESCVTRWTRRTT